MADGQPSHAPSVSIGTSAENWVNNLVEGESTDFCIENGWTKDEAMEDSHPLNNSQVLDNNTSPKAAGNETSYGTIGSTTAADLVRDLRSFSTPQASPRPRLPSIYNSPFAPLADEEAPLTANHIKPSHSQQNSQQGFGGSFPQNNSQQGFPILPQQANGYFHHVDSSMSSFGAPSSIGYSQSLPQKRLTTHSPRNFQINYEESQFMSSNIFSGSPWDGTTDRAGLVPTPPNGQGG